RTGLPRHPSLPGRIHGYAEPGLAAGAPEIRRVDERRGPRLSGIELGDEGILPAGILPLQGAQQREVDGGGVADHVDLPCGVDGETVSAVATAAAKVRTVHERGSAGIQPHHEGVRAAAVVGLEGVLGRESPRGGLPSYIDIAGRVDRDAVADIETAASQEGRI